MPGPRNQPASSFTEGQTRYMLVSIFNTRLKIIAGLLPDPESLPFKQTVSDLRAMLERIPQDSFPVRKVWTEIEQAWQRGSGPGARASRRQVEASQPAKHARRRSRAGDRAP